MRQLITSHFIWIYIVCIGFGLRGWKYKPTSLYDFDAKVNFEIIQIPLVLQIPWSACVNAQCTAGLCLHIGK